MPRERQPLAMQVRDLQKSGNELSKATPRFLVNIADKGLTAPASYLESTLALVRLKH
jgi:hypothetical protein